MMGDPLPVFSDPLLSVTVLAPTNGSSGVTACPGRGRVALAGSYSADLLALNGT
jgi:hypothetical protein